MDYNELRMWIENDEGLYWWQRRSGLCMSKFIVKNRRELVLIIKQKLGR